jgi:hypothetical protein
MWELRRDTERNAKNQCVGNNRNDKYKVDADINDVEGGPAQSRSRYETLGEQRRQRGLRLHGVGFELRSKERRELEEAHTKITKRGVEAAFPALTPPTKSLTATLCTAGRVPTDESIEHKEEAARRSQKEKVERA